MLTSVNRRDEGENERRAQHSDAIMSCWHASNFFKDICPMACVDVVCNSVQYHWTRAITCYSHLRRPMYTIGIPTVMSRSVVIILLFYCGGINCRFFRYVGRHQRTSRTVGDLFSKSNRIWSLRRTHSVQAILPPWTPALK